jgi:hypothetical protein
VGIASSNYYTLPALAANLQKDNEISRIVLVIIFYTFLVGFSKVLGTNMRDGVGIASILASFCGALANR